MNLSKKTRALVETAIEAVLGLAVATPVLLASTGVNSKVGAGAVVLAVSVAATNLVQLPAVERALDKMLGTSGTAQLVSDINAVEQALGEHVASHGAASPAAASDQSSGTPATDATGGSASS